MVFAATAVVAAAAATALPFTVQVYPSQKPTDVCFRAITKDAEVQEVTFTAISDEETIAKITGTMSADGGDIFCVSNPRSGRYVKGVIASSTYKASDETYYGGSPVLAVLVNKAAGEFQFNAENSFSSAVKVEFKCTDANNNIGSSMILERGESIRNATGCAMTGETQRVEATMVYPDNAFAPALKKTVFYMNGKTANFLYGEAAERM